VKAGEFEIVGAMMDARRPDEAAAREAGLSLRTYQRRKTAIKRARAQAGIADAQAGEIAEAEAARARAVVHESRLAGIVAAELVRQGIRDACQKYHARFDGPPDPGDDLLPAFDRATEKLTALSDAELLIAYREAITGVPDAMLTRATGKLLHEMEAA
jgi:hypothetical protein